MSKKLVGNVTLAKNKGMIEGSEDALIWEDDFNQNCTNLDENDMLRCISEYRIIAKDKLNVTKKDFREYSNSQEMFFAWSTGYDVGFKDKLLKV
jgi:hypothetical protein